MVAAVRVHQYGGPEVLTYEEVDLAPPGPGELRVRQGAIGVNYIDTYFRTGHYQAPSLPFIAGNEAAGEIVSVGSGVTGFKPGERVAYVAQLGCYTAERNVPAAIAVKLPEGISDEVGAVIMLKGMTVEYLLHRTFKIQPGDTILLHAAAGGIGLLASQWAKHLGATVIGTAGSPEKAALAKAHGCDHVILYRDEDFAAKVKEITGGKMCDVVYDGIGRDTVMKSLDCLKPLGTLVNFGSSSGAVENFNLGVLASKGSLFVTRPTLGTFTAKREWLDAISGNVFQAVKAGIVKVDINKRAKLKDAADVHRALEGRETNGAIVMTP